MRRAITHGAFQGIIQARMNGVIRADISTVARSV